MVHVHMVVFLFFLLASFFFFFTQLYPMRSMWHHATACTSYTRCLVFLVKVEGSRIPCWALRVEHLFREMFYVGKKKKGAGLTGTPFLTINHALDGEGTITFEPDCWKEKLVPAVSERLRRAHLWEQMGWTLHVCNLWVVSLVRRLLFYVDTGWHTVFK